MMPAIYMRTSTTEQNPENQGKACRSMLEFPEQSYHSYIDEQSAWKDHAVRHSFNLLKENIKQGKIKELIVWDLDRIYRRRKKLIEFFKFCQIYGCKIKSYRQQWLNELSKMPSPWDEIVHGLMLELMGWMAEEESQKKSKRVKAAIRNKNGKTISYKGNKWGRKSISTQKRNLILNLRSEGLSLRAIAKQLNLSVGVVHKTLAEIKQEKTLNLVGSKNSQLMNGGNDEKEL